MAYGYKNKDISIFASGVEEKAIDQIEELLNQTAFDGSKIRIMPDVHAGKGCVIGFTADLGDKVIPNIVGVDIGCGMLTVKLEEKELDLEKLDKVIRKYIPSGRSVHGSASFEKTVDVSHLIFNLNCLLKLKNVSRLINSMGTLGGGNHFIEVDKGEDGQLYLIIHTGSRNLGVQVANYYQELAIKSALGQNSLIEEKKALISALKAEGRETEIQESLKQLEESVTPKSMVPAHLAYLTGKLREDYLHDMRICQEYAKMNREIIWKIIQEQMQLRGGSRFHTVHNYIDHDLNIVRKGATSAQLGEEVLIPMNMRDGCILGVGKGNPEWNYSAPHGAGRIMSRTAAKNSLSMEDYKEEMKGIYTTSINKSTLDESPAAYKAPQHILAWVQDTVDVIEVIKPIYNFKASE